MDDLVVPHSKVDFMMHLAHSRHLASQSILEKIKDQFLWPGMKAEVKNLYQNMVPNVCALPPKTYSCSTRTSPAHRCSLRESGHGLGGSLSKSAWGHEHVLVIMDYATRYPEAVPLWKATSKNIAQELVLLFSHMADLHHLKSILSELREAGLTANPWKCYLGLAKVQYLGYCIGLRLLKPQEKQVEAVQKYP